MSTLDRQINHARRRLTSNVFAHWLSFGLLLTAGVWALAILVVRLLALNVPLEHGVWAAAGLAGLFAAIATGLARPSSLRAAVALDAAAGLKERLSTALLIRKRTDPFAQAAVRDAEQVAARVHVPAHIRHRAPPLWPWSAATMLAALMLHWFMPTLDVFAGHRKPDNTTQRTLALAEHQAIKVELEEKLNKIKELAQDNPNLKDLAQDIQPLDLPNTPGVTPEDVRREAVKRIDDVSAKLKRELEATETNPLAETKRLLNKLEPQGGDKAGAKLSQTLASGDFEGAKQALQKMKEQIEDAAKNATDPESQQKLAELQQQLTRLADQVSKLSDTVQLQKELQNKGGLSDEEAKKLLDELSKMDPKQLAKELQKRLGDKGLSQQQIQQLAQKIGQNQQCKQACQKLAQSLAKAAQAAQQCQSPGAADAGSSQAANALSDAASQLSEMEMSEQMMSELQAQISDLQNLRDNVCQGQCQGNKPGQGRPDKVGSQGPNYGLGLGDRVGRETTAYQTDPTKAQTRFQGGTIIGQMLVDGPQVRGAAAAESLNAAEAQVRDALDAIEREEVPRQYRKVLQEYFERLAGLVHEKQAAAGTGDEAKP